MLPEIFQTRRVVLRPIRPRDAADIFDSYAQDAEVTRYLTWRPHRTRDETKAYIKQCLSVPSQQSRTYIILDRDDAGLKGAFDLRRPSIHRLEFGYVLARACWGMGIMTEVLSEVVHWAATAQGIHRIGAYCDVDNIASARVMEKAGLTREGLLLRWLVHPNVSDEPRDCFSYVKVW